MGSRTVEELIPHRGPMVLLDDVLEVNEARAVCRAIPRAGGCFVVEGELPSVALVEHMAQAAAVWAGHRALTRGGNVRRGAVIGVTEIFLKAAGVRVDQELTVVAARVMGDGDLGSFRCTVHHGDDLIAEGTLSVMTERE